MGKGLFYDEVEDGAVAEVESGLDSLDPAGEIDELGSSTGMALEGFKTASGHLRLVEGMRDTLTHQKALTAPYNVSLENCRLALASLSGTSKSTSIPALEDFKNPYAAQASQQIALEGIGEFIKSIWKKFKDFMSALFKRIGLFFKRILRMELDLSSYETYTQNLVAKLRVNKAINNTNRPIPSRLPALLAQGGMSKMDDKYLTTEGLMKIYGLQKAMHHIGFSNASPLVNDAVYKNIEHYVGELANKLNSGIAVTDVTSAEQSIKVEVFKFLDQLFPFTLTDDKDLPEDAYDRLYEEFDRAQLSGGKVVVRAVSEVSNSRDSLPAGVNMFMFHVAQANLFITGSSSENTHVDQTLMPINNLDILVKLEEDYRKRVKPYTMKGVDKFVNQTEDRINKLMRTTEMKLSQIDKEVKGYTPDQKSVIVKNFVAKAVTDPGTLAFDQAWAANVPEEWHGTAAVLTDLSNEPSAEDALKVTLDTLSKLSEGLRESFYPAADAYVRGETASTAGGVAPDAAEALRALTKFILNFLSRLQVILRELMTNFYGTYSKVRFEMVKYIYESARQFSY
ncbi:MAG: hypothetical protein PHN51_11700 [Candidatus Nanopelagicales bacterium]|nr:hypothetical protein [Candidatus Nanopelagicales bacterium]